MKPATVLLVSLSALAFVVALFGAAQIDGKAEFQQRKCNACHTVDSEGIAAAEWGRWVLADMIEWKKGCDDCTPDLSMVGERRTAEWLKDYLKCKKHGPSGRKHNELFLQPNLKIFFKVPPDVVPTFTDKKDEESLDALVTWLMKLKKQKE